MNRNQILLVESNIKNLDVINAIIKQFKVPYVNPYHLMAGMMVEMEHIVDPVTSMFNFVRYKMKMSEVMKLLASIALSHIKEYPDYYPALVDMELKLEKKHKHKHKHGKKRKR